MPKYLQAYLRSKMKTAVIYARFSSHTQTEQSIEGQLRECYAYAKRNDIAIVGEYIDRALTGTTDKRPNFLRMIDDSKKKMFQYVLVYQLDRFARNRYDSANYKAKLKKNGVRVLSARENITEDASGILVEGLLESMAEYYSAELSQKVKRGVQESLRKGHFLGGVGTLGYNIKDKKWVVNSQEADIVREAFTRYKNGEKAKDISEDFNRRGIRTKTGSMFKRNDFPRLIRNKKYIGLYEHKGELLPNIVPAIVDEQLFYKCNEIMDKHKHRSRETKQDVNYILSGKLYCGHCGSNIVAECARSKTGKMYHYYKCINKKHNTKNCTGKTYPKQELENYIFSNTVEHILKPKVIDQIAELVVNKFNSEIKKSNELTCLEKELKNTNKSIKALLQAVESGIFNKTTQSRMLELEQTKERLEESIAVEQSRQVQELKLEQVKAFLNYFAKKKYKDNEEKNEFFNCFINRVILFDDKAVIIYNTEPDSQVELNKEDYKQLIDRAKSKTTDGTKNATTVKQNSPEPSRGFERVAFGGAVAT